MGLPAPSRCRHGASALVRLWALQGSNPRPPPCKGERSAREAPGQAAETATDLRKRVSESARGYQCVSICHGPETDSRNRLSQSDFASRDRTPPPLFFSVPLSSLLCRTVRRASNPRPSPWQGDAEFRWRPLQPLESKPARSALRWRPLQPPETAALE